MLEVLAHSTKLIILSFPSWQLNFSGALFFATKLHLEISLPTISSQVENLVGKSRKFFDLPATQNQLIPAVKISCFHADASLTQPLSDSTTVGHSTTKLYAPLSTCPRLWFVGRRRTDVALTAAGCLLIVSQLQSNVRGHGLRVLYIYKVGPVRPALKSKLPHTLPVPAPSLSSLSLSLSLSLSRSLYVDGGWGEGKVPHASLPVLEGEGRIFWLPLKRLGEGNGPGKISYMLLAMTGKKNHTEEGIKSRRMRVKKFLTNDCRTLSQSMFRMLMQW